MNYKCLVCGYQYQSSKEAKAWDELGDDWSCPACSADRQHFLAEKTEEQSSTLSLAEEIESDSIDYPQDFFRQNDELEPYMNLIHEMSVTGTSVVESMRTQLPTLSWNDIHILGAQLDKFPLNANEPVSLKTVIGKNAKYPLVIESPIIISHMSFGALSKELKIALAQGSAAVKTAMSSGEGGILPEEMAASYKYIFEYVPNLYSVTDENLKRVDAVEIKIGQGTKPGMGGHLPGEKVTEEIAKVRNKPINQDIISPARFKDIKTKADLKELVSNLRERTGGKPIGIKIAAGHIERDLEFIGYAQPDFVTIDGRGGSTGATHKVVKDATSIPTIFALYRARKYLNENDLDIDLIVTGGLRIASDFAKALAMGADAIAIATSALMATVCQQYRICHTGKCPVGGATQDPELRQRLHIENSARRLSNFLKVSNDELKTFARLTGSNDVHALSVDDLVTVNSEISNHTNIPHA